MGNPIQVIKTISEFATALATCSKAFGANIPQKCQEDFNGINDDVRDASKHIFPFDGGKRLKKDALDIMSKVNAMITDCQT